MYYYWALIRNIYYNYCVCILVSDDVLKFLQDGLSVRLLASVSAVGIQNLCRYCKGQMANLFDTLLEVVRLADSLGITNNSVIGLLTGECHTHLNHCGIIIFFFIIIFQVVSIYYWINLVIKYRLVYTDYVP